MTHTLSTKDYRLLVADNIVRGHFLISWGKYRVRTTRGEVVLEPLYSLCFSV
jgi:hypothetical protein